MAQLILCVRNDPNRIVLYCEAGNEVLDTTTTPTPWVDCGSSQVRILNVTAYAPGGTAFWERRPISGGSVTAGQSTLQADNTGACD